MTVADVINILGEPTTRYQAENGRVVFNSKNADVANWLDWQHKSEGVDLAPYIGARVKDGVIVELKANRR